jgi:pimeloyl-ACP methyl ester carboxylesterase
LAYKKIGEGHPFIIVHGLYGMSDNWLSIANALKESYQIFLPDMRNHGMSEHTPTHTYEDMSRDLEHFFRQHEIERGILMGHSMGGKAAMRFALQNPEMISALIVADIAPVNYGLVPGSGQIVQHASIVNALQNLPLENLSTREEAETELNKNVNDIRTTRFLLKNLVRDKNGFRWKLNLPVLQQFLKEISGGFEPLEFNPATSFPVLFIRGSKSDYVTIEGEKAIRKLFPFAKIESVEDAGHWLHADQPEKFIVTLKNFLF